MRSRAQPGRSTLRLVDGHQAQGSGVAGQDPGQPVADGPPGEVAGERAVHLQRQHHRRTPAGLSGTGRGVGTGPVDDRPVLAAGVPRQGDVGADRHGLADRREEGEVGVAVGIAVALRQVDALGRRPSAASTRRGTRRPAVRRRGSRCRCRGRRRPRSAASMWSKRGAIGRVSGRIAPVIRIVVCPAARCSRMRRTAPGASRDSTWSVSTSSTTASRSSRRAPAYSR